VTRVATRKIGLFTFLSHLSLMSQPTMDSNLEPVPNDLASEAPPPAEWWESVLRDPRAAGKPWLPIQQLRLSEIPRHLLRVECLRCFRIVEIQKADAIRLCEPHAVWKDVGQRLLDDGCQHRTGRHEEDGCWPNWTLWIAGRKSQ
jgi:hypothetical protein